MYYAELIDWSKCPKEGVPIIVVADWPVSKGQVQGLYYVPKPDFDSVMQLHLAFRRCRHKKGTGMFLDCDADAIVCKAGFSQADLWMHAWPNSFLPVHDTQIRLCENMPGASELLPVIVQDVRSKQILMFAWTDAEAFFLTKTTRHAHYYSRSRKKLWKKGEESGNAQIVRSISSLYRDDWQCLIFEVSQRKAACHAGYRTCFYRRIESDGLLTVVGERVFDPALVYKK